MIKTFGLIFFMCLAAVPRFLYSDGFGYTEPVRSARPAFAESGILSALHVKEGDAVKTGQVLAELDNRILVHDRVVAEQQLRLQAQRHDQLLSLRERGNVSEEEYERARADWMIAKERVARIQSQIETRTLRAPFDGVVLRVFREISESIAAQTVEVLSLVNLDELDLVMNLSPVTVADWVPGQTVTVDIETDAQVAARLIHVSPVIDSASQTVRVRLRIENGERLFRAGMRCRLSAEEKPPMDDDEH